jgi:hypothetical protein
MDETTNEVKAEGAAPEQGYVLAAPGSQSLRWICEACAPSHLRAGWKHPKAELAQEWFAAAQGVGQVPAGAILLEAPVQ